MERATALADLIPRAAKGETAAGAAILAMLASGNPEDQLATLRALNRVADAAFWGHTLEYLATGRWGAVVVPGAPSGSQLHQTLQPKIRALFLAAAGDGPSGRAREEALLRGVASPDLPISCAAIDLVGGTGGPRAIEPLAAALRDSRQRVQLQAVRALGQRGDARAVPALVEALRSEDELLAALAKDALVTIGPPALPALSQVLDDQQASDQVRWMAARALARIGDARAIPTLIRHLNDANYGLRWLAAEGLVALGAAGLRALLPALTTQPVTPWLADSAAHVLRHARPPAVKEIVKPVLEALRSVDAEWAAPTAASRAVEELDAKGLL